MSHDKPMPTAGLLIAQLRKLPKNMPVDFSIIHPGWLGAMKPIQAFQVEVWNEKGNAGRKPYSKKCRASIYIGELP